MYQNSSLIKRKRPRKQRNKKNKTCPTETSEVILSIPPALSTPSSSQARLDAKISELRQKLEEIESVPPEPVPPVSNIIRSVILHCGHLIISQEFTDIISSTLSNYLPGHPPARFVTFEPVGNSILVTPIDDYSREWLISTIPRISIKGFPITAYSLAPTLARLIRILVTAPGRNLDIRATTSALVFGNPQLYVQNWELIRFQSFDNFLVIEAFVEAPVINGLEALEWKPFFGLLRATAKPAIWLPNDELYKM